MLFRSHHLSNQRFVDDLLDILKEYHVATRDIIIEFTETTTIEHLESMKDTIEALHLYGFKVSMDDFGYGYSSFGSLDEIYVDEIKLDRSLIKNIAYNRRSRSIVHSIILRGKSLDINVVAEGVEMIEQVNILKTMDCNEAQGYYFYKPMIMQDFTKLLKKKD